MKDNIDFCRKLFEKLIENYADSNGIMIEGKEIMIEGYDAVDYYIILDYFSLKVLELLEHYEINRVNKYNILFKEFQANLKLSKHPKALEMEVFFFTLNNLLIDRYEFTESNEYVKDYIKNLMRIME